MDGAVAVWCGSWGDDLNDPAGDLLDLNDPAGDLDAALRNMPCTAWKKDAERTMWEERSLRVRGMGEGVSRCKSRWESGHVGGEEPGRGRERG